MTNRLYFSLCFSLLLLWSCSSEEDYAAFEDWLTMHGSEFSILIRDGSVYNGSDTTLQRQDVLIRADTVAYVGVVDTSLIQFEHLIDAEGKIVAPGFIDSHAHGDPLRTPEFSNFLSMGVTTICLGQDGSSPAAPDIAMWMDSVDAVGPGVNIAMLVGHGSLRLSSGVGYKADPAEEEIAIMQQQLAQAMDAGCFGMSSGLEYTPGHFAGTAELSALAQVIGRYDGVIMSHMRSEDDNEIEASIQELLQQAQYCHVHAAHLKVVYGKGSQRADQILSLLFDTTRAHRVTADLYPYLASYTGIGIVFPDWAKQPHDYQQVKQQRKEELLSFLRQKVRDRNGPEATLFGSGPYAGQTLAELSRQLEMPYEEILLEIGPTGASGAYFVMDDALQQRLLQAPLVAVSSDGSPSMHHPRGYGSFAKVIETYVYEREALSLSRALEKMTALPARILGLSERGCLQVGCKADIVIFDPQAVRARATYQHPHLYAEGFDYVLINGQVAVNKGNHRVVRFGKVLRKR